MGHGSYKASDWAKLKDSRGIKATSDASNIFTTSTFKDKYNPLFIDNRESCDSEDSPESTPVILAFDVTGSMGYLAAEIAKNSLNKTVLEIYDKKPVTNPHVMCGAFTSPGMKAPLQVTQFEADIRIVEQLLDLWVGFGGNKYSYDSLVWYFAAKHTKVDSYEKRGKKGFIFCIGDEICGGDLSCSEIRSVFGDEIFGSAYSLPQLLAMASKKYEVFHITTGNRCESSNKTWEQFMPGRVAPLKSEGISYLSEVIISIMQMTNGMDKNEILEQWDGEAKVYVENALGGIRQRLPGGKLRNIFFKK